MVRPAARGRVWDGYALHAHWGRLCKGRLVFACTLVMVIGLRAAFVVSVSLLAPSLWLLRARPEPQPILGAQI
jgi:hypothetical protein